MNVRGIIGVLVLGGIAALLQGCPDPPPPGPDLVSVSCMCKDGCAGGTFIAIGGQVCTDASVPGNLQEAQAFICDRKETTGFNVCKIEDCTPQTHSVLTQGCPADNGDFATGDFGQSTASAVAPSNVQISGDDINAFTITPQTFTVDTTQEGSTLFFTSLVGTLGTTTFTSDGIFGNDNHTIADGRLSGAPFSVTLQEDGSYTIPPGVGNFITTAELDGDRLSLTLISLNLGGVYNETAGVFTLAGTVQAIGADINMSVNLVFNFTNRPPRAVAGPDQVVECSANDQTAMVSLSGSGSFDLDGNEDIVRYTWFVDGVEAVTGPEANVNEPINLGAHEVQLIVADQRGSFGGDAVAVTVEDTTAPTIEIVQPMPIAYTHSETIVLAYTVTDGCTGVADVIPLLDGLEMVGGHGLQSGQPIHLLTELALGDHTFSVAAVDEQGNSSTAAVVFSIVVTPESIQDAVAQLVASEAITHPSGGQFLLGKLQSAAQQYHNQKCTPARNIYEAFIHTVEAQRGKTITPAAADILIGDAQFLIDHCPQLLAQGG